MHVLLPKIASDRNLRDFSEQGMKKGSVSGQVLSSVAVGMRPEAAYFRPCPLRLACYLSGYT